MDALNITACLNDVRGRDGRGYDGLAGIGHCYVD